MCCSLLRSWRWWGREDDQTVRWRWTMLALSPLDRVNKRLTADFPGRQGPCSSFVAAIDVFGQLSVGHATCWSWWSPWHGGVTGCGHGRHCAVGIGTVWSGFACVKRIRRHRGGALAPSQTSRGFRRFGEVGSGASAPPLRRRIRFSRLYSLHSLSLSTAQRLSCPILATPPCHGAQQNSMPHG